MSIRLGWRRAAVCSLAVALAATLHSGAACADSFLYGLDINRVEVSDSAYTRPLGANFAFMFCYPAALPVIGQANWRPNTDFAVQTMTAQGLDAVITLSTALRSGGDALPPLDTLAWKDSVSHVVERYDGDGNADMPGLTRPVKYWHVEQEMSFWTGSWSSYATHLGATARAIRGADPTAKVILIGLNSSQLWGNAYRNGLIQIAPSANQTFTTAQLDANETNVRTVLAAPGYDIVDMHSYEEKSVITGKAAYVRSLMPNPAGILWCMEGGGPFQSRAQGYTDTLNAAALVRQTLEARGAGIGYYSWLLLPYTAASYSENWNNMPLMRLVANVPAAKPAYAAYKQMMTMMRGTSLLADLSARTHDENHIVFVERFSRPAGGISVIWCERDSLFAYSTNSTALRVTPVITTAGASTAPSDTLYPVNGWVTLAVGPVPVYVEDLSIPVGVSAPESAPLAGAVRAQREGAGWAISWSRPVGGSRGDLTIVNVRGVAVATLTEDSAAPASQREGHVWWDGRDRSGARVPRGVYLMRLTSRNGTSSRGRLLVAG